MQNGGHGNVKSEHGNVVNNVLSNVNKFYTLKELLSKIPQCLGS